MSLIPADKSDELWWANERLRNRIIAEPEAVLRERGLNVPGTMSLASMNEYIRLTHLLWLDRRLVPVDEFRIDPSDEGLLLGRGVWESTKTIQGVPWLWELHIGRMLQSAELLGIKLEAAQLPTAEEATEYARVLTQDDLLLRLNATAGRPGGAGLVWMSASPLPHYPTAVRLRTVRNPVQKGQAYLLLKTFQYATRLQVGQQAAGDGFDSALMIDDAGLILEAAHANVFLKLPDGWATPAADGGFLPGTVRQFLLDSAPIQFAVRPIPVEMLAQASEVFITNSNAGLVPVTRIDGYNYRYGADTQSLQAWLTSAGTSRTRYLFAARGALPVSQTGPAPS